uniref:lysozyme n=1 Tax=Megaselia scalaris TaxID=36166 RepID=T1GT06_MEGSC
MLYKYYISYEYRELCGTTSKGTENHSLDQKLFPDHCLYMEICWKFNGLSNGISPPPSDLWWCSPHEVGKGCHSSCDKFEDNDISDDVACVRTIKAEHDRLFGNGFTAWTVYNLHCAGNTDHYLSGCGGGFSSQVQSTKTNWIQNPPSNQIQNRIPKPKGKVYSKCELAEELRNRNHFPEEEISTW